jgi:CRISPR/Cas system CSM-associated protein Csm3 (group 7 of RAMP superfamily)
LIYTLKLEGDLHSGTGMGLPGLIDEFVVRDAEGLAYLPASHIKGLIRDSCYRLWQIHGKEKGVRVCSGQQQWQEQGPEATYLGPDPAAFCGLQLRQEQGSGTDPQKQKLCLMCALFGAPSVPGSLWFSPATYPDTTALVSLQLAESDSALRTHTALDRLTRRAKENQLFQLEVINPLDDFIGEIFWEGWVAETELSENDLFAWLTASLLFIRHVGRRRRRGWGRGRFSLPPTGGTDNQRALDLLEIWLGEKTA